MAEIISFVDEVWIFPGTTQLKNYPGTHEYSCRENCLKTKLLLFEHHFYCLLTCYCYPILLFLLLFLLILYRKKLIIAFLLACLASNCGIKMLPSNGPLKIDMYQQHQQLSTLGTILSHGKKSLPTCVTPEISATSLGTSSVNSKTIYIAKRWKTLNISCNGSLEKGSILL